MTLLSCFNKPKTETQAWYDKSNSLLKLMIEKLWDGEHFVGLVPALTKSFSPAQLCIICRNTWRSPAQNIIDKMADDLMNTEKYLSPTVLLPRI